MLYSFGLLAHAKRRVVIAVWIVVLVALGAAVGAAGNSFSTQFTLPDVESAEGFALLCVAYPKSDCVILTEQEENL